MMIIAIDFDGTCVEHRYPEIGDELPGCIDTLKELISRGHRLVLNTMRGHPKKKDPDKRDTLQEALDWFQERGIVLSGVNVSPGQWNWTTSSKVYANLYIDDAALGCPRDKGGNADWSEIRKMLGL